LESVLDLQTGPIVPNILVFRVRTINLPGFAHDRRDFNRITGYAKLMGMTSKFHPLLLAKLCLFQATFLVGSTACQGQQAQGWKPAEVQRKEAGQLPKVPTVESMLRPDAFIERFLSRTPTESAYEKASSQTGSRSRTTEVDTEWDGSLTGWNSPEFYTHPLYFEQINFERYETSTPAWTRPMISYSQFLANIPVLPYKMGTNGPRDRIYTVGHYQYGQVAPAHLNWGTPTRRGMLLQGVATTGLIFFIP